MVASSYSGGVDTNYELLQKSVTIVVNTSLSRNSCHEVKTKFKLLRSFTT